MDLKNMPKDAFLQGMKSKSKKLEIIKAKKISMHIFQLEGRDSPPATNRVKLGNQSQDGEGKT